MQRSKTFIHLEPPLQISLTTKRLKFQKSFLRQYMIGEKLKETSLKYGCPATQQKLFPKI